jgi:hypothetical protein
LVIFFLGFFGGILKSIVGDGKGEMEKMKLREAEAFGKIEDRILDETLDYLESNFMRVNSREYTVLLGEVKGFCELKGVGQGHPGSEEKIKKVGRLLEKVSPEAGFNLA